MKKKLVKVFGVAFVLLTAVGICISTKSPSGNIEGNDLPLSRVYRNKDPKKQEPLKLEPIKKDTVPNDTIYVPDLLPIEDEETPL